MRSESEQAAANAASTATASTAATARSAGPPAPAPPAPPVPGLRERKKAKTRAAIRQHALRLFRERGYYETTVEQIAAAAEVSPSTFFRYFPTKEDVVLQDDVDLITLEAFEAQPPGLSAIAAMRAALRTVAAELSAEDVEQFRESSALSVSVPEIRARAFEEFAQSIRMIAEAISKRAGRDADNFAARNLAGAIVGVVMSATLTAAEKPGSDILEPIDAALAHLEAGLPL